MQRGQLIQGNSIQRQSIAPGHGLSSLQADTASKRPQTTQIGKSQIAGGVQRDSAGELLDLNDINLRLSENLDYEKNLKHGLTMTNIVPRESVKESFEEEQKCAPHNQDFILFCLKC